MGDFATVSHLLRSKMCGEEFDVKVLLPFSYTITEGAQLHYPTIYLLDPEPCLLPLLVRVHFAKVPANTKSNKRARRNKQRRQLLPLSMFDVYVSSKR